MDYQIRRGIFETSSSSASVMTMISDSGRRFDVKLDKTWICVRGCYNTSGDGIDHVYLNSWSDKMAFLADDTPIWHEMFKKTTGQDFVLYKLFSTPYEYKDAVDVHMIPDAIVPENRLDGYMQIVPELEYVCGVELTYLDNLVALPADTPDEFLQKYHLERVYSSIESYMDILELKEIFGENEVDERLLEEIVFNPAIAFNIGGDAFDEDRGFGVINGYYMDKSVDNTFKRAHYSMFGGIYHNGNETLILGLDGTKVRICRDEKSEPEYPESIDVKITDCCEHGCPFCYEGCTAEGLHGEIPEKLFKSLPPFTELAIGGGNPLLHPEIATLRDKFNIFMNITIRAEDFEKFFNPERYINGNFVNCYDPTSSELELLKYNALGISVSSAESAKRFSEGYENLLALLECSGDFRFNTVRDEYCPFITVADKDNTCDKENSYFWSVDGEKYFDPRTRAVIHAVNGVIGEGMLDGLFDKELDLLVLGYKTKGRGVEFAENGSVAENQKWLYDNIESLAKHFRVVAFDNLALEQLDVRRFIPDEDWKHFYMGDEGTHSMYIDLVKKEYGISSTDNRRWALTDDIKEMFRHVRSVSADTAKQS